MTPSADKRTSGNPAAQAKINLTVKQQREQQKQAKLADYQKQLAQRRRSKLVWWVVGSTAAVAIIGLIAASVIFAPKPVTYEAGNSTGREIDGVETFEHVTTHVEGAVTYEQTPPAGGEHNPIWLNCGVYTEPQANENAVHSLEHGAIWITYDPEVVSEAEVEKLQGYMPSTYALLSPYPGMDTPIAVSAWNAQLKVDSADDERIEEFFTEYWRSQNAPEPNAICSGALDGPGKA
ncbi:DUF3105 domain-containing protein [Microbacterium thalli]|uniref:DUF3105 domain-containing protein n=1 Tax=Microbacterium thalli TaxID=3027921 RepID=A0ABT5SFU7_9MICO|nr:DUF3105 domain-containing protein [Microbacterium thalli]MDD7961645.1 DUF3105 domain-containing protein [Microbacterium thalli]MDN8549027.1 DUF3105 domain-containing protein [Microbacterium thalli]